MLHTILEPDIYLSSEERWAEESDRDIFLTKLLDTLQAILALPSTSILWSDALEMEIWSAPHSPPWRVDRDMKLKTVPVIHHYFQKLKSFQTDHSELEATAVEPPLSAPLGKDDVIQETCKLISLCFALEAPWRAVRSSGAGPVTFTYDGQSIERHVVRREPDWAQCSHVRGLCWPKEAHKDSTALTRLVVLTAQAEYSDLLGPESQLKLVASDQFLDSVVNHGDQASVIIKALAKRAALGQARACRDSGLRDEGLYANPVERRFRTSGECRIHYSYDGSSLVFERYYGPGEHDQGL